MSKLRELGLKHIADVVEGKVMPYPEIGDHVKICDSRPSNEKLYPVWDSGMDCYCGKIGIVTGFYSHGTTKCIKVGFRNVTYYYRLEWLKII